MINQNLSTIKMNINGQPEFNRRVNSMHLNNRMVQNSNCRQNNIVILFQQLNNVLNFKTEVDIK